ncbi:hypothetical protein EE612_027711 [Oryza sativa]|nr:hypothetical protein EE612_027711 [Oryza sativa]
MAAARRPRMSAVTRALSSGDLKKAPARPCTRRWRAPPSTRMDDSPISSISDLGYHGTNADASLCSTARLASASALTTAGDPHRCDLNTFPYLRNQSINKNKRNFQHHRRSYYVRALPVPWRRRWCSPAAALLDEGLGAGGVGGGDELQRLADERPAERPGGGTCLAGGRRRPRGEPQDDDGDEQRRRDGGGVQRPRDAAAGSEWLHGRRRC